MVSIDRAQVSDLEAFFRYFERHLAENGNRGEQIFLPLSAEESRLSESFESRFRKGVETERGQPGWRGMWLAKDERGSVIGHIDIRHHPEGHTAHRVLLGIGVDRDHRRGGVGSGLFGAVIEFCEADPQIEWLDLWVISSNTPAVRLYHKMGFVKCGEVKDMFRIDGRSYGYAQMSRSTSGDRAGGSS